MAITVNGGATSLGYSGVSTSGAMLFSPGGVLHTGDCMLVATIAHTATSTTANPVTSITDSAGNTWLKYTDSTANSGWHTADTNSGTQRSFAVEVWYTKNATCNTTINITVNHANNVDAAMVCLSGKVLGYDTTQPFDQNASLPKKLTINGGAASETITGISTNNAHVMGMWSFGAFSSVINTSNVQFNAVTRLDQSINQKNNTEFVKCQIANGTPVTSAYSAVTFTSPTTADNAFIIGYALTSDASAIDGNASGTTSTVTTSLSATGTPTGDAGGAGATLTVTTSLIPGAGSSPDGHAFGTTSTVTTSLIAGTPSVDNTANGATMTVTTSLSLEGTASDLTEIDGNFIYEMSFNTISNQRYQGADYYSIFSTGDRNRNGLINAVRFGAGAADFIPPAGCIDNNYAHALGSGWSPIGQNPQPLGGMYLDFGGNKVTIAAFKLIGSNAYTTANTDLFQMLVGFDNSNVLPTSYATEFDAFLPQQATLDSATSLHYSEYITTPRVAAEWNFYQFQYFPVPGHTHSDTFAEELELKIFHSILDGGDRRTTNGNANKRTAFSMSAGWHFATSGTQIDPADAWFDGSILRGNSVIGTTGMTFSIVGKNAGGTVAQDVAGEYFQFVFPRIVIPLHILLQVNDREVYDSGGNPTIYGKWHWEYSLNGGISYTPIGIPWQFVENCDYMLGPNTGETFGLKGDTTLGDGATHWRMVLDAGPAFGNHLAYELMFNLHDIGDQTQAFEAFFSDDADGVLPFVIVTSSSPYIVNFTDGTDDKLTYTLTNTPNPLLSAAFTDESAMTFRGSFEPSTYVQTVVVMTGKP